MALALALYLVACLTSLRGSRGFADFRSEYRADFLKQPVCEHSLTTDKQFRNKLKAVLFCRVTEQVRGSRCML